MQKLFLTFFGTGLLRPAPGTWGSLAGAVSGAAVAVFLGLQTLFLASILLFLASIKVIDAYEKRVGSHDSSEIVIDEVAGVWVALSIGCYGLVEGGGEAGSYRVAFDGVFVVLVAVSFGLFRLFDITKPSIIGRIDRGVSGGLGVMGDDMVAGVVAGLLTGVLFRGYVMFLA